MLENVAQGGSENQEFVDTSIAVACIRWFVNREFEFFPNIDIVYVLKQAFWLMISNIVDIGLRV